MEIGKLLEVMVQLKASDLHLQVDSPPRLRVAGTMSSLQMSAIGADDLDDLIGQITDDSIRQQIESQRSADFAHCEPGIARFRVNVFHERDRKCVAMRLIPFDIPTFGELRLPKVVAELAHATRGLVLVTGTTGSGKSTTLAALIDLMNRTRRLRIITIEDPIEFVHASQKSLIAQRQLGSDTPDFSSSLREALRQDPDVILVGELRDAETMRTAMQAADTGHLVFSTIHTTNATYTVQRVISMFPPHERELMLMQLSANLEAVVSQRLAKAKDGGRIPVVEIMRNAPVIRKTIFEGNANLLPQAIANGEMGMQLFDQHLAELYNAGLISGTEGLRLATNPEAVALNMRGISTSDTGSGLVR